MKALLMLDRLNVIPLSMLFMTGTLVAAVHILGM